MAWSERGLLRDLSPAGGVIPPVAVEEQIEEAQILVAIDQERSRRVKDLLTVTDIDPGQRLHESEGLVE